MVAAIVDQDLATGNRQRRFGGNFFRGCHDIGEAFFLRFKHIVDQTDFFCLCRINPATGIGHFLDPAFGNIALQAREGTDIGGHADIGFLDAEHSIFGAPADIARADHVDCPANNRTVKRKQNGYAGFFQRIETMLDALDIGSEHFGDHMFVCAIDFIVRLWRENREVHAGGEMLAGRTDHNDSRAGIDINVFDNFRQIIPERPVHAVEFFRTVHPDMRDIIFNLDIETFIFFLKHDAIIPFFKPEVSIGLA